MPYTYVKSSNFHLKKLDSAEELTYELTSFVQCTGVYTAVYTPIRSFVSQKVWVHIFDFYPAWPVLLVRSPQKCVLSVGANKSLTSFQNKMNF